MEQFQINFKNQQIASMNHGHFHEAYELVISKRGSRTFFVSDQTYTIQERDAIMFPPKIIHRALRSSEDFERYLVMIPRNLVSSIQVETDHNLFECFYRSSPVFHFNEEQFKILEQILELLLQEKDHPGKDSLLLKTLLTSQLLVYLNRYAAQNASTHDDHIDELQNGENSLTKEMIDYLFNHYADAISLELLEQQFFTSSFHLCKVFKRDTGFTIMEYLNYLRIRESIHLLEEKELSITEIGYQVGYNSTTHFIRCFKQKMEITPKQFRLRKQK
ncbi:MAG: helix-turn-helix domain-containing protein [Vallitaleaceae bacterium]|nr:helix-turn-helix domain-containing protein [Vallitaleaceae bacterium]